MEDIVIKINWAYFLGIIGTLIVFAWYSSGRFTKIETNLEWLKGESKKIDEIVRDVNELRVNMENKKTQFFATHSPIRLTDKGETLLNESGLKSYIDTKTELIAKCENSKLTNAYEVQSFAFDLFDSLAFDSEFDLVIKQYSYDHGISLDIVKRVGALYFRDLCLKKMNMPVDDIDKHDPKNGLS